MSVLTRASANEGLARQPSEILWLSDREEGALNVAACCDKHDAQGFPGGWEWDPLEASLCHCVKSL